MQLLSHATDVLEAELGENFWHGDGLAERVEIDAWHVAKVLTFGAGRGFVGGGEKPNSRFRF